MSVLRERRPPPSPRSVRRVAGALGALMVTGAGVNAALLGMRPAVYADLGDWLAGPAALNRLWVGTLGNHPLVWVPIVGIGYELLVGVLALASRRRYRLLGLAGIGMFHLGLLVMGLWPWALPVLALVAALAALELRSIEE